MSATDPTASLPNEPMSGADDSTCRRFFEEVLIDYIMRCEEGRPPDIDAYLARYPRHSEQLARLLSQRGAPPVIAQSASTQSFERGRSAAARAVSGYEILFRVSGAGAGRVFKARHKASGRLVALKVMSARDSFDEREFRRFKREAEMLRELEIPEIVDVLEVGESGDSAFMTMPWVDGASIQEAVQMLRGEIRSAPIDVLGLTLQRRARIIATVGRTLGRLGEKGILHRDIKPSNIMLTAQLEPLLIDFGIARSSDLSRLTRTHDQPLGTPRYLAPELLMGDAKAADARSDQYALGVTLYEFLTLRPAFDGHDRRSLFESIAAGTPKAPTLLNPDIPDALSLAVLRAMSLDPKMRFETWGAFADALENSLPQVTSTVTPIPTHQYTGIEPIDPRSRTWLTTALFVALAALIAILVWVLS